MDEISNKPAHILTGIEANTGLDKILVSLAAAGEIRLPVKAGKVARFAGVSIRGKSITETIVDDRRWFIMDDISNKPARTLRSFTSDEAQEFKEAALSSVLRDDMRKAVTLRKEIEKKHPMNAAEYLEWLTSINSLCNAKPELRIMREQEQFMRL